MLSPCPEWLCLWHVNLHVDSLSILCIHWLFTIFSPSIHCRYFCVISSEELLTGKGCLSIHIVKKEKIIPSYSFPFKTISGPHDFIRPCKFICHKTTAHIICQYTYSPWIRGTDLASATPALLAGIYAGQGSDSDSRRDHATTTFQRQPGLQNVPSLPSWLCHAFKKENYLKELVKVLTWYDF